MSGWGSALKAQMTRSRRALGEALNGLKSGDADTRAALKDALLAADLGVEAAHDIAGHMRNLPDDPDLLRNALAAAVADTLADVAKPLTLPPDARPAVVLLAGINGTGKTTTAAKLARRFLDEGKSVMLAACDTFRAAADTQLQIWGERLDVPVICGAPKSDAAGLAFEALTQARATQTDILLVDTAGRLQSDRDLMAELEKIVRVLRKIDENAPHAALLVLDATTGRHALTQAEGFLKPAAITGLIMTKLDSTARGGALVGIARTLALPVHFIGAGEETDDLYPFDAAQFAAALVGADA